MTAAENAPRKTRWRGSDFDDYGAMLTAGLEGYADYARRVRFRLVPGIW